MTSTKLGRSGHEVAVVGVGSTGFAGRDLVSPLTHGVRASKAALDDAGIDRESIDGVCGTGVDARRVISALGIPEARWFGTYPGPAGFAFISAAHAVAVGLCRRVLCYNVLYRSPAQSRSAASDPFRRTVGQGPLRIDPENVLGVGGYSAWAARYMYEFGIGKEPFALVALNGRANASNNPLAVARTPLTMEDYEQSRMVRSPLCLYDMDIPIDGADAFILTTTRQAEQSGKAFAVLHSATCGIVAANDEDQLPGLESNGQHVVARALSETSDVRVADADLLLLYDGFTFLTLTWLEALGLCGPGEAGALLAESWDKESGRVKIRGRALLNSHGGSLSEGGSQGSGQIREAVTQVRGSAADRQIGGVQTVYVTIGGFYSQGLVLVRG